MQGSAPAPRHLLKKVDENFLKNRLLCSLYLAFYNNLQISIIPVEVGALDDPNIGNESIPLFLLTKEAQK